MQSIQEAFDRISQIKKEQKNAKAAYKDALENSDNHRKISEEMKSLREKKKQIETIIQKDLGDMYQKIEDLDLELKGQKEMIGDIAISSLMKGETVEVKDEYGNFYEPVWSVKFKKNESKHPEGEL
ncbi:hypothetical protein KJ854_02835 [Patescibacteria group bacterium]|nr:hypothetical protein [Patescibacteria group bacterium]